MKACSYMNPVYVENHGQTVYFTMSLYDSYDVYLMRARFNLGSVPCPADQDLDGDVDGSDAGKLLGCMSGAGRPYAEILTCSAADLDHDGDVDQSDFGIFQRCLNEQPVPADPNCANP